MKRIVSIIISVLLPVLAAGQSVYVADFKPEASGASDDLESVSVTDASGNICSVVKVLSSDAGWTFDAGLAGIVDVRNEKGSICLYIPATARTLSFSHPKYGAVQDWIIPQTLQPGCVYSLKLKVAPAPKPVAVAMPALKPAPDPTPKPVTKPVPKPAPTRSLNTAPQKLAPIRGETGFADHFIDFTMGVSLSKYLWDEGYDNTTAEWEASEYWFGMTYAWVGKRVGPYINLSLSDCMSFAGIAGVTWRVTDPYSDTLDLQFYGGLGLSGGRFAIDGGMRFGWRSSGRVSKWDFGVGLRYSRRTFTPTVNLGFYIWGIPVIVGVGLLCYGL